MNQFDYMRKRGGALGSKKTNKSDYLIFSQTLSATCVRLMALFSTLLSVYKCHPNIAERLLNELPF